MTRGQEALRWLALFPALLIGTLLVGLVASCNDLGGKPGQVLASGVTAFGFVRLAFELAPRWKTVIAWLSAVVSALAILGLVAVMTLASLDAFGTDHPPFSWLELVKGVAWWTGGFVSLQECVKIDRRRRRAEASAPPHAAQTTQSSQPASGGAVVEECLHHLEAIKAELQPLGLGPLLGLPADTFDAVEKLIEDEAPTVHTVVVDKVRPRDLVWVVISNVTGEALATGQFHIYRNVLSMNGKALLWLFSRAVDELERSDHYTGRENSAASERAWIRKRIADAG